MLPNGPAEFLLLANIEVLESQQIMTAQCERWGLRVTDQSALVTLIILHCQLRSLEAIFLHFHVGLDKI